MPVIIYQTQESDLIWSNLSNKTFKNIHKILKTPLNFCDKMTIYYSEIELYLFECQANLLEDIRRSTETRMFMLGPRGPESLHGGENYGSNRTN